MARDQVLQPFAHAAAAFFGHAAVDDQRQRIDRLVVDEDVHLDEVALAAADLFIVEAGIAAADRFKPVVEIEHHFVQRQFVAHLRAAADIGQVRLDAAAVLAQFQDRAEIFVGRVDHRLDPRFFHRLDPVDVRPVGGIVDLDGLGVLVLRMAEVDPVHDRGGRGDEVEIVFAAEALLDDFQVQQAEEARAEAEAQRGAAFHLVAEARIVQPQLADALAQLLEIGGVDREQAAEDHGLDFLVAFQRLGRPVLHRGDGVADAGLLHLLDLRGDEADFARAELRQVGALGGEAADAVDQVLGAALHEPDLLALLDDPVHHAHQDDDAEVRVVPAVDQHRFQRCVAVAGGRRDALDQRFQRFLDADARFGAGEDGAAFLPRAGGLDADDLLDLLGHALRFGGRQVDLVDDGDDLVVVLDGLVDIGQRLRFHPLRRVHHQQRALARGQAAADLIGEVDVAGRVHEVQLIGFAIARGVVEAHGLRLDRDPPLLLDVHVIKDLLGHLPVGQPPGKLDQPISQRRLAMVDVGYDGEIADLGKVGHCAAPLAAPRRPVSRQSYTCAASLRPVCLGALAERLNCAKPAPPPLSGAMAYLPGESAASGTPAVASS